MSLIPKLWCGFGFVPAVNGVCLTELRAECHRTSLSCSTVALLCPHVFVEQLLLTKADVQCKDVCCGSVGITNALMYWRALFLQIIEGKTKAHFIMDDPAGNSYLQVQWCALRHPDMF